MASQVKYVDFVLDKKSGNPKPPFKKYSGDAGWDLFVSRDAIIQPHETADIHTDIRIKLPPYTYGRITGRSSTLRKHDVLVNEAIIDNGFTGELFVCIRNLSDKPFEVKTGMRLAQIMLHRIEDIRWSEVEEIKSKPTERGIRGFGSTGE